MSRNFVKFGKVQVKVVSFQKGALLWNEPIFEKSGKMSTKSLETLNKGMTIGLLDISSTFWEVSSRARGAVEPQGGHQVFADVITHCDIRDGCHLGNYDFAWHPLVMSRLPVSSLKGSEWPKPQCRGAQLMLRSSRKWPEANFLIRPLIGHSGLKGASPLNGHCWWWLILRGPEKQITWSGPTKSQNNNIYFKLH